MESILEEFARGNISPEPRFFKRDSHYGRTLQTLTECEKRLLDALEGDLKQDFITYIAAQSEISLISGIDRFKYGYQLATLLTMEIFENRNNLLAGGAADRE